MKSFFSLLLFIFFLGACAVPSKTKAPILGELSSFSMENQDGQEFTFIPTQGKVGIASFIFTRCGGICPMSTQKMRTLSEEIQSPDFMMMSLSVDPKNDTPEELKKYREKMKVTDPRWQHLTAPVSTLHEILVKNFKVVMGENIDDPIHSDKIVLFDQRGRVRGYYGLEDQDLNLLKNDIRILLKDKS